MKTPIALFLAAGLSACVSPAMTESAGRAVEVEIQTDAGRTLPLYPAANRGGNSRVYAEAIQGERYRIVIHNTLNRRVGLVIAVDGRNIISGKKSWLKNDERMYILEPYASQEYAGWRTSSDHINRFYFTDAADSYAAAFNDESAMGIIAVATYVEVQHWQPPRYPRDAPRWEGRSSESDSMAKPSAGAPAQEQRKSASGLNRSEAGTGYGPEAYSPSYSVAFEPEAAPREKTFIKYEWRETLSRLGVIPRYRPQPPRNRLWDGDFAPPPPRGY